MGWKEMLVPADAVLERIRPGMSVFLSTGAAEPRTLVKHLMAAHSAKLQDLELIQIVSFADAISLKNLQSQKFRLKTFFSGWVADEAITAGHVDLIPCYLSRISELLEKRKVRVDIVFVQITPPDKDGYCSLGVSVDVARLAMEQANLVVGEINTRVPRTLGDTFVQISAFDMLVQSDEPPVYFERWSAEPVYNLIAANIEPLIEDQSCIAFSMGPLFESLGRALAGKQHLGVHSPFFSDALMDLVKSGAVTNRCKELFRRKSITSYACGTAELFQWLDQNPAVEFQPVDKVFDPLSIGRNPRFVAIISARSADITGRIALHTGLGNVASGPAEVLAFLNGAQISEGGYTVFGLPSRSRQGEATITTSIEGLKNRVDCREAVDYVVTEFGVASLKGLTLRERAQALIEIAHPDDRVDLIAAAKRENILYRDQIYLAESIRYFPSHINECHQFKGGVEIRFRPIRPSDEEEMRRLFYRFSDESVYYRYFSSLKAMPHTRMQTYVNVDWSDAMSIVGVAGKPGMGVVVAEARYLVNPDGRQAEIAFVVDEAYQSLGISTYLFKLLVRLAKERGIKGFWADVLASNAAMMKVFHKGGLPVLTDMEDGVYHVTIPFD
ncbi:GNAT family N-acetyltransferase [Desulfosarcina sp.]|uniref:GNAT family N-acetyltransferase n=1 Tax=Desulfosarcina sp. TaxID=2027861 RepID=UPI003970A159